MAILPNEAYLPLSELDVDEYIGIEHLARALNVSTEAIRRWRRAGQAPAATMIGPRLVRFRVGEVRKWLAANTSAA